MIISLYDAQDIDSAIQQSDLDSFEQSIRALTNNNFQNMKVRFENVEISEPNLIVIRKPIRGLRIDDTIEVNYSDYNDGLYVVEEILANSIRVQGAPFLSEDKQGIIATMVTYPADVKRAVKGLIAYDLKMTGKIGIKSETISRMSTTYYDVNSTENINGYPSSLLSFLVNYEKMRWG
jgi:hypothetical protein